MSLSEAERFARLRLARCERVGPVSFRQLLERFVTEPRSGLVGQAYDLTQYSRSIPFNDVAALEAALAQGDVCALLCEPAMTNIGMVLPEPGFMQTCRELTRKYGALLIIDETHTISTDMGGCTKLWNLDPDFFVVGKPIAGGVPCGIFGCSAAMAEALCKLAECAKVGACAARRRLVLEPRQPGITTLGGVAACSALGAGLCYQPRR